MLLQLAMDVNYFTKVSSCKIMVIIIYSYGQAYNAIEILRLYSISHSLSLLKESPILSRCSIAKKVPYMISRIH